MHPPAQATACWNQDSEALVRSKVAESHSFAQSHCFFLAFAVRAISGAAIVANWGTNLWNHPTRPRKYRTSFFSLRLRASLDSFYRHTSPPSSWYPRNPKAPHFWLQRLHKKDAIKPCGTRHSYLFSPGLYAYACMTHIMLDYFRFVEHSCTSSVWSSISVCFYELWQVSHGQRRCLHVFACLKG